MLTTDYARLCLASVVSHRLRSFLTGLGITVGIAAVVLLTSIGEGIHRFMLGEFTHAIVVHGPVTPHPSTSMDANDQRPHLGTLGVHDVQLQFSSAGRRVNHVLVELECL